MALDRTWYNSLVDDDGSGLTGSVWDKADVDALMDAIDLEMARLDAKGSSGLWTPVLVGAGGGTPTYSFRAGAWSAHGSVGTFSGRLTLGSVGSLNGALSITGQPVIPAAGHAHPVAIGYWAGLGSGLTIPVLFMNGGSTVINLYAGVTGGSSAGPLGHGNIVAGFDIIFGGSIRI